MKNWWCKLLICLLVFFMLKSCLGLFYTKMTHLLPSDLEWIKAAKNYPRLHFESQDGKKATLEVISHYINNTTNPFYISEGHGGTYYANAGYKYWIQLDNGEFYGWFQICLKDSLEFDARVGDRFSYNTPISIQTFNLNGKEFRNSIIVNPSNSHLSKYNTPTNPIKEFVINKKYGLIYFGFANGDEYSLKFKNKTKKDSL